MRIVDYDPTKGQAFQGDVSIMPIPEGIKVSTIEEVKPVDGRLILQEGETSGHHHAVALLERPATRPKLPKPGARKSRNAERLMADALAGNIPVPTAKLYRDPNVPAEMVRRKLLTRADLAIAVLVVENGPMVISHEEHDGIRVPPGRYLIGRQVESAGAEERVVFD